jgi:hypothetical protein
LVAGICNLLAHPTRAVMPSTQGYHDHRGHCLNHRRHCLIHLARARHRAGRLRTCWAIGSDVLYLTAPLFACLSKDYTHMSASPSSISHTLYSNLHISTAMAESTHILVPIPPLNLCAMCDEPGTQTCSRCNSIRYCSKECQKVDFALQKLLCKTINDFKNPPAPYFFRSI